MSYILDALKKSEEKRNILNLPVSRPALAPASEYEKRRFSVPIMFFVAALVAGWSIAQWQQGPDKQDDQGAGSLSVKEVSEKLHLAESSTFSDNHPPIHVDEQRPPIITPITPASPVSGVNAVPVPGDKTDLTASANTVIQSLSELPLVVQQSVPDIKIEGHIYDADPLARMVIINGKVRKEKQRVGSAMTLQEITLDGVIIYYQGRLFHVGMFD